MASPLLSPRVPSLHRADGHASPFLSSPPLVEEDALVFRSSPLRDASPFRSLPPLVEEDASVFRSSPQRDASPFHSSSPLVEEDASVFRSSPLRVEVDASAFPISPARASKDASAPRYKENAAPPADPPSLEELWKEMDVALCGRLCLQQSAPK
nr:predicted protein [Triticum aestivum]